MNLVRKHAAVGARSFGHARFRMVLLATTAIVTLGISISGAWAQALIDGGATETVPGTQGTPWNINNLLEVGKNTTGTLNIGAGGTVNNIDAILGENVSSSGVVTVNGINARWMNSGDITIGSAGTGQVTVSNHGHVFSQAGFLGVTSDAIGTVTVDGAGSDWISTSVIIVGFSGTGTLSISNQANVTTHDLVVGSDNGSTGTVTVSSGGTLNSTNGSLGGDGNGTVTITGTGSSWINSADLHIGESGIGHLTISNGGTVFSTNSVISFSSIATGVASTVTVTGPGSTWTNTGDVFVGQVGSGGLSIDNGGVVSAANVYMGATQNAAGSVSVDGANSQLTVGGEIHVGDASVGTLTVTNGAKVTSQTGHVGFGGDGIGSATIDGTGSSWINSADLYVGNNGNGTLNILNGGLVTSVAGAVGLNSNGVGAVTVDGAGSIWINSSDLYVGGAGTGTMIISNKGTVSNLNGKIGNIGTGVVTVTGANSTWVNTADLTVGNGGNGTLNIQNGAGVSNMQGYVGGAVGGVGVVNVTGPTSLWLNIANLHLGYAGDGTLNVSNGGAISAVATTIGENAGAVGAGTVDGAGTLWLNSSSLTVGDAGTGSLTISNGGAVSAGGMVTLADQAGSSGTLNIGAAAGSPATGAGTINAAAIQFGAGTGTVNFNHTETAYNFAPSFSGAGTINQLAGNTNLTADSSGFTGTTNVLGGRLAVNGSLANSIVTVSGAGILGGNGMVGGIVANAGGIVGPGNSIGTLNVNGNVSFMTGSVYQVEVNAAGQSDKVVATGTATINGGTVQVLAGLGNYAPATTYTILTGNNGRSGTFDAVTSNLAFLAPSLTYDPNNVYLTLTRNNTYFATVGVTPNQIATGSGVESLGFGNTVYNAILNLSSVQARTAFDQLSGEVHASAKSVMIEDSRFVREAAVDRLRAAFDGVGVTSTPVTTYIDGKPVLAPATTDRFAVWGRGFGSWGRWNGDGNAATIKRDIGGFFAGADGLVADTWRAGVLGGYSRSTFNVKDRNSSGTSDDYHVGLYGGTNWDQFAFRSGLAYTWHDISTRRSVAFQGFADQLKGDYNAGTMQAFGEFGYGINAGQVAFEPFANLAYVSLRTDSFGETGGAAALSNASSVTDATFTTLGLRASSSVMVGAVNTTVRGTLGWRHALGNTAPLSTFSFVGGSPFTIAGVPITRDATVVDTGLDFNFTPDAVFSLSYGGQFGSGLTDQTIRANFSARF